MAKAAGWAFTKRFRRGGFGWRASRLATERIAEALAALHLICQGRGCELTSLDVQMAYRLANEAGNALGQPERVALRIQTMLKPTTGEVRWVREMVNLPVSSEAGPS